MELESNENCRKGNNPPSDGEPSNYPTFLLRTRSFSFRLVVKTPQRGGVCCKIPNKLQDKREAGIVEVRASVRGSESFPSYPRHFDPFVLL